MAKSIISGKTPKSFLLRGISKSPKIKWRLDVFQNLVDNNGYEAYIDKAMRCPCVDKTSGAALPNCKNCLGRGYFFVDRKLTTVISQSMNNKKHFEQWSETNRGIAKITALGVDKMSFMDRIILLPLTANYYEVLRPTVFNDELLAYPIYEPIEISNIFLFKNQKEKLIPLTKEQYQIIDNKIVFDKTIIDLVPSNDVNSTEADLSVAIHYSYHPVYHVVEINRELMKVHDSGCNNNGTRKDMPINVLAKKAHYIFDAQRYDNELLENTKY